MKKKRKRKSTTPVVFTDETKVHPNLRGVLCYCMHKSALILKSRLTQAFIQFDLTLPHFGILRVLSANEELNQNQLGEQLGIDKASMVKLLDHLENLGYVERTQSRQDRRVKNLRITTSARILLEKAHHVRENEEVRFLSSLSPADAKKFRELVVALLAANS